MTKKRTPEAVWQTLEARAAEDELARVDDLTGEELDRELLGAGLDAGRLGTDGAALAAQLLARRDRLSWQAEAQARLDHVRATVARRDPRARRSRPELLAGIAAARSSPHLAQPVAVMFRNRSAEEASDEELEALLEELEALAEHGR